MKLKSGKTDDLLALIRTGKPMTRRQQIALTLQLSAPAILAQLSSIMMQYIDASMVGRLGANASASIGLIETSTWLLWGISLAATSGFSVQVAQLIGAGNNVKARSVLRQAITTITILGFIMLGVGCAISPYLPYWLGGNSTIATDSTKYFLIFSLTLPAYGIEYLAGSMLRCSGNMRVPSILNIMMCLLDVVFNMLLIFPSHTYQIFGMPVYLPGAGLGVVGAALGTALAVIIVAVLMMGYLLTRSKELRLSTEKGSFVPKHDCLTRAAKISLPIMAQHIVMCGAQVVSTLIVAPLGILSIAANSFAITAESLCYMPGYGIADAATTLIGQSVGAGRHNLTRRFAHISIVMGMTVMTVMGIIMFIFAPYMMELFTPNTDIQALGTMALRIEAFAEPMFAAAIVTNNVFVGAGDTLVPSIMNLGSMWAVRLTLAALLAPILGLKGVWIAMCTELCFRGAIFLLRLNFSKSGYFSRNIYTKATANS